MRQEKGGDRYEVIYPSGYSRDCYAYDETSPIEGSSCCLQWEKADDYEKTYDYDMHILDENGSVLYRYPDVGSRAMRGSVWEDGKKKHTVYTFDYVTEPEIDTSDGVKTRIKFYISENQLKVAWTSYEPVGDEHWEYLEKKAYEISLTENAFKSVKVRHPLYDQEYKFPIYNGQEQESAAWKAE